MSPIGPYSDFKDCVSKNQDKKDAAAFCAYLEHKLTGKWPSEMSMSEFKTKTVDNVEVFATGTWTDSAGQTQTFTEKDLDSMVKNFEEGAVLKAGHSSDEFNDAVAKALGVPDELVQGEEGKQGAIGLGNMTRLIRKGKSLFATFADVPEAVAELIKNRRYTSVSAELSKAVKGFVIRAVALLGAQRPAVSSLEGTLSNAMVYSYSMEQPTQTDVRPVAGGNIKKRKQEANMAEGILEHKHDEDGKVLPTDEEKKDGEVVDEKKESAPAPDNGNLLQALAVALGLDPNTATAEEIISECKALKSKTGEDGSGATAATGPLMAKFTEAEKTIAVLQKSVDALTRDKKLLQFSKRAENWNGIVTDAKAEVEALVDMPVDAAMKIVSGYDRAAETLKRSGFFERVGGKALTPGNTEGSLNHPFAVKVQKFSVDNKVDYFTAMLRVQTEDKKGYEEYMKYCRENDFAGVPIPVTK